MSVGTFETSRRRLRMSVYRGRPEVISTRQSDANDPYATSALRPNIRFAQILLKRLSSGRSIEFVAPLLDPIRSDVEDPTSTHTETTKGLPTGPGLACSEKIQEGLLGA